MVKSQNLELMEGGGGGGSEKFAKFVNIPPTPLPPADK